MRPTMCEREAKDGWKTVEVSRYDVPLQKASMAVPFRSVAMVYITRCQHTLLIRWNGFVYRESNAQDCGVESTNKIDHA